MDRAPLRFVAAFALALVVALPPTAARAAQTTLALGAGTLAWGVDAAPRRSELWLRVESATGVVDLPVPGGRIAALRAEPLPIVEGGALAGLVWLEGERPQAFAVRYAPWRGEDWGAAETVSPPGPGSQLALSAATLADGRLLLVWAAFDGEDDEILFSLRRVGGGWSAPARVDADDAWPDVTPAVTAADEGALVAWSGYDGDQYRVYVARFDGERFRAARAVGPQGSVFPTFAAGGGAPLLVYRNALPRGWSVAELDRSGAVRRQAFAAGDEREAPRVERRDGALELRWADSVRDLRWR